MATIGDDGDDYRERLAAFGIGTDGVRLVPGSFNAQAFIITDLDDNQITAFHPGAMKFSHQNRIGDVRDIGLGIVAPDGRDGMWSHVEQFALLGIPFVFDPGQAMPLFSGDELLAMIDKADYLAVNDYEGRMLEERTGLPLAEIAKTVDALVVTLGARRFGDPRRRHDDRDSRGEARGGASIPTGCGDAYRAGLLYGIANGWDWERTGRLASVLGALKIASRGGAEPRRHAGDRRRALPRHVRRAALVTAGPASPPERAGRNALHVQCYRWTRTCVHVLAGVATTMFVFPLVGPAPPARAGQALERPAAAHPVDRGARSRASSTRTGGNVLVVANHISWLDIFVLNAVHPVRFVAKSELARWPVVSQMIRGAGTVFIERERRRDTHRVNHQMARVLADGDVVAIFPEGTTTDGVDMLPFKSSLLQPIVEAEGHVQPVAIRYRAPDGAHHVGARVRGRHVVRDVVLDACAASARIRVVLRAQVPLPARDGHRRDLARAAEEAIRTALAGPARATAPGTRADPAGERR